MKIGPKMGGNDGNGAQDPGSEKKKAGKKGSQKESGAEKVAQDPSQKAQEDLTLQEKLQQKPSGGEPEKGRNRLKIKPPSGALLGPRFVCF